MIVSDPPGASVVVKPDYIRCVTPCEVALRPLPDYVVEVAQPGYETVRVSLEVGSDPFLEPNPVRVKLNRAVRSTLPVPVASLDNCIQPAAVDREICLGRIRLGATRAAVEAVLGPPDAESRDATTLRYGDRYLKFDVDGLLAEISDDSR